MRTLFLLLVLANLALFAWMQWFGGDSEQRDPRPLKQQVAPDQVRILTARELGTAAPRCCKFRHAGLLPVVQGAEIAT